MFAFARCERVFGSHSDIYGLQRSCSKVMFSQACVKNSIHGGVYPSMHLGRYIPPGRYTHLASTPPWQVHPSRQVHTPWQLHPPRQVHPPAGTLPAWAGTLPAWAGTPPARYPPGQVQPPADGYCRRQYASYWNAFLFTCVNVFTSRINVHIRVKFLLIVRSHIAV